MWVAGGPYCLHDTYTRMIQTEKHIQQGYGGVILQDEVVEYAAGAI